MTAGPTVKVPNNVQEMEVPLEDPGDAIGLTGLECPPWEAREDVCTRSTVRGGRGAPHPGLNLGGRPVRIPDPPPLPPLPPPNHSKFLNPSFSNHLEERLLDQAQARASYTPLFWGHLSSIPQDVIFDVQPLVKALFCPIRQSPNGFFDSEASDITFLNGGWGGGGSKQWGSTLLLHQTLVEW